jgi:hypothetical protein
MRCARTFASSAGHSRADARFFPNSIGAKYFVIVGHAVSFHSLDALAVNSNQEDRPVISTPKARLKKMNERHVDLTQCDGFDFHLSRVSKWQSGKVTRWQGGKVAK